MVLAITVLGAVFAGFMITFWFTPIGIPGLRRLGGGATQPDLAFSYRPDETYRLLELYGAEGVAHWRRMLWLDMVFPAVYAALFALLGRAWAEWVRPGPVWATLAVAGPIAAGLADYIENILLLRVTGALPARRDGELRAASLLTSTKHLLSRVTLAIPLVQWGAVSLLSHLKV